MGRKKHDRFAQKWAKRLAKRRFPEDALHGHPHHVPTEIEIEIRLKHRYPRRSMEVIEMAGYVMDTGAEPGMKEEHYEVAVEQMFNELKKRTLLALKEPGKHVTGEPEPLVFNLPTIREDDKPN